MKFNKQALIFIALPLFFTASMAQNNPVFKDLIVGGSYTYIFQQQPIPGDSFPGYNFFEHTFRVKLVSSLSQHWRMGVDARLIKTIFYGDEQYYFMAGLLAQYIIIENRVGSLFIEGSYNRGNYCLCGENGYSKIPGLNYLGAGMGNAWHLYRGLWLDLGWSWYWALIQVPDKYAYSQYIIGLKYKFPLAGRVAE